MGNVKKMNKFPDKKYAVILSDPPWSFNNKNTGGSMKSGASAKYTETPLDKLCALPVHTICADDCVLFMWWVGSQPEEALHLVKAWGFKFETMTGFTWIKLNKEGEPAMGMGFRTRQNSENCLIATKGRLKVVSHSVRSTILAPRREHSQKPTETRDRIVQLYGDVPRIELFARGQIPDGWDSWGDEVCTKD